MSGIHEVQHGWWALGDHKTYRRKIWTYKGPEFDKTTKKHIGTIHASGVLVGVVDHAKIHIAKEQIRDIPADEARGIPAHKLIVVEGVHCHLYPGAVVADGVISGSARIIERSSWTTRLGEAHRRQCLMIDIGTEKKGPLLTLVPGYTEKSLHVWSTAKRPKQFISLLAVSK